MTRSYNGELKKMHKHELANLLLSQPDGLIKVSIDISIEDDESTHGDRAFGDVIDWQEEPNDNISLLCEGTLNK